MRKIITTTALLLGVTIASTANADVGRWGEEVRFVSETAIPNAGGIGTVSLCHVVDFADVLFVPVYTSIQGYALSNDGCTGAIYSEVTPENVAMMQVSGLIPADISVIPSADLETLLWGHAWLILAGVGLLFCAIKALTSRGTRKLRSPDMLVIHSLVAMSQVAIANGRIDDGEVHHIANILTRLTGKSYAPQQIMEMLGELNPSPSDIEQVGQDLSKKDRQIVLEAALNIAVADGEIHPNEYAVVSDLAQRMRIGADQFRSALASISAHLQTIQPA